MFSLTRRLFSPISKSWFSSGNKAFECRTRRRIFVNLKEVFAFSMEETTDLVPKTDLQFTSIVAHNYLHTQADDEELRENLVKNVEHRDEDLTPNLALDIVTNFKTLINTNEGDFYANTYGFIKKYCYLFQAKQLDKMEKTYYYLYKKGRAQLNVDFVDLIRSSNNHGSSPTEYTTNGILEFYGIEIPKKHMKVYIYPNSSIIRFNFLKIQKTMTLVGVGDTIDSLSQLANIINEKEFDFFLMGLSPVSQADLVTKKRHVATPRDIKKHIDPSLYDAAHQQSQAEGKHQHLELFEKYRELAFMDGELTGWYKDNVLSNQDLYQPDEEMRVVCREKKGLSRIDPLRTILYSLSMKNGEKPKVLFTDMELFDEVNKVAQEMDLEAVKDLFHYARYLWLQEHIRWGITVNKNGCPQCSATYEELPRNLMEIISKRRYNFSIREKYIANQIVQSLVSFKENKSYIGFYKKNMIPGILRQISRIFEAEGDELANYSEQAPERTPELEEQLYELLLRKDDRNEAIPVKFNSEQARKEYTDKFAMLLTILEQGDQRINVKIPKEADIDHTLYAKLKQEYQTKFTVESFIDHQVTKFAKEKGAPQCFASNVIFNKP